MHIREYFAQGVSGRPRRLGQESDWLDVGTLDIHSGKLSLGDSGYFPEEQIVLDAERGTYEVQAKALDYGSERRISRFRAFLPGRGYEVKSAGDFPVDVGSAGLCDYEVFHKFLEPYLDAPDAYDREYSRKLYGDFGRVEYPGNPPAVMVYVQSGWGDGSYPAYRFVSNGRVVGVEAVFIQPDEEYLFERVTLSARRKVATTGMHKRRR